MCPCVSLLNGHITTNVRLCSPCLYTGLNLMSSFLLLYPLQLFLTHELFAQVLAHQIADVGYRTAEG